MVATPLDAFQNLETKVPLSLGRGGEEGVGEREGVGPQGLAPGTPGGDASSKLAWHPGGGHHSSRSQRRLWTQPPWGKPLQSLYLPSPPGPGRLVGKELSPVVNFPRVSSLLRPELIHLRAFEYLPYADRAPIDTPSPGNPGLANISRTTCSKWSSWWDLPQVPPDSLSLFTKAPPSTHLLIPEKTRCVLVSLSNLLLT